MRQAYFITATDTDAGKTFVAAGLAASIVKLGRSVGVFKPVETGVAPGGSVSDAEILAWASGRQTLDRTLAPYRFREATSPHVAAKLQGARIDENLILESFRSLAEANDVVVVEGAGGILVPLRDDYAVADLVHELEIPVILVAKASLGTLNHTLLTLRCCQDYGIAVLGIVVNVGAHARGDLAERTNPEEIARISGIPVLGTIPPLAGLGPVPTREDIPRIGEHVAAHIDIARILAWKGIYG